MRNASCMRKYEFLIYSQFTQGVFGVLLNAVRVAVWMQGTVRRNTVVAVNIAPAMSGFHAIAN
jgi:hypothetical protein